MTLVKEDVEWLDCSTGVIVDGIRTTRSGQIVRMYYEAYGNPENDPGEHDRGPEIRRVITLRAIEAIPLAPDSAPTILFEDEEGNQYCYTKYEHVKPITAVNYGWTGKYVLTIRESEEMIPIGINVAFAIPDNERMSPQLKEE